MNISATAICFLDNTAGILNVSCAYFTAIIVYAKEILMSLVLQMSSLEIAISRTVPDQLFLEKNVTFLILTLFIMILQACLRKQRQYKLFQ